MWRLETAREGLVAGAAWERLAALLGDPDLEELHLDSTSVKAHQVASTGRRRPRERKRKPTRDAASVGAEADWRRSFTPSSIVAVAFFDCC
jgi:hypothetical protein